MSIAAGVTDVSAIPGLEKLWAESLGDPAICIAVLDGPVDGSHPSFSGANLIRLKTLVPGDAGQGLAPRHGTHVASVIFGQHTGAIRGIAPRCRGLIVPIFADAVSGSIGPCSQIDLARAITEAVEHGADIINISGGEFSPSGTAHPLLADAVRYCAESGVLIVAAAGNQGCDCLDVPGAMPSVLAVGAMSSQGQPLEFSNWGEAYQVQGILAPGENIPGARPGGGTVAATGTSFATPIVSGVAALLLSIQLRRGHRANPHAVRSAILHSALDCEHEPVPDCRRLLAGRLNIEGAMRLITRGVHNMSDQIETQNATQPHAIENGAPGVPVGSLPDPGVRAAASDGDEPGPSGDHPQPPVASAVEVTESPPTASEGPAGRGSVDPSQMDPAACECAPGGSGQLVFGLGKLDYDFGTEARSDSIQQHMGQRANPRDHKQLLDYLDKSPWDAASIIWTLNLDATPIYAVQPGGPFAADVSERLRTFLREQLTQGVERVSIPGRIMGTARLLSGQVVPSILPELRGMYSWTTAALVEAVCGRPPARGAARAQQEAYTRKREGVTNFLVRVYHELRNLGRTPQERAINYSGTDALLVSQVFEDAIKEEMSLDTIEVERSPICRPDSDCWDVKLTFFNPSKVFQQARKVYRFTVDVSDVVPVMVGEIRSWFVR